MANIDSPRSNSQLVSPKFWPSNVVRPDKIPVEVHTIICYYCEKTISVYDLPLWNRFFITLKETQPEITLMVVKTFQDMKSIFTKKYQNTIKANPFEYLFIFPKYVIMNYLIDITKPPESDKSNTELVLSMSYFKEMEIYKTGSLSIFSLDYILLEQYFELSLPNLLDFCVKFEANNVENSNSMDYEEKFDLHAYGIDDSSCDLSKIKANESSSMEMQIREDYAEDSQDSTFEFRLTPQVWPCLYGKKVAFTNVLNRASWHLTVRRRVYLEEMARCLGACVHHQLDPNNPPDLLFLDEVGSFKYHVARNMKIPMYESRMIEELAYMSSRLLFRNFFFFDANHGMIVDYKIKPLSGIKVYCSGYNQVKKRQIMDLVPKLGGQFMGHLDKKNLGILLLGFGETENSFLLQQKADPKSELNLALSCGMSVTSIEWLFYIKRKKIFVDISNFNQKAGLDFGVPAALEKSNNNTNTNERSSSDFTNHNNSNCKTFLDEIPALDKNGNLLHEQKNMKNICNDIFSQQFIINQKNMTMEVSDLNINAAPKDLLSQIRHILTIDNCDQNMELLDGWNFYLDVKIPEEIRELVSQAIEMHSGQVIGENTAITQETDANDNDEMSTSSQKETLNSIKSPPAKLDLSLEQHVHLFHSNDELEKRMIKLRLTRDIGRVPFFSATIEMLLKIFLDNRFPVELARDENDNLIKPLIGYQFTMPAQQQLAGLISDLGGTFTNDQNRNAFKITEIVQPIPINEKKNDETVDLSEGTFISATFGQKSIENKENRKPEDSQTSFLSSIDHNSLTNLRTKIWLNRVHSRFSLVPEIVLSADVFLIPILVYPKLSIFQKCDKNDSSKKEINFSCTNLKTLEDSQLAELFFTKIGASYKPNLSKRVDYLIDFDLSDAIEEEFVFGDNNSGSSENFRLIDQNLKDQRGRNFSKNKKLCFAQKHDIRIVSFAWLKTCCFMNRVYDYDRPAWREDYKNIVQPIYSLMVKSHTLLQEMPAIANLPTKLPQMNQNKLPEIEDSQKTIIFNQTVNESVYDSNCNISMIDRGEGVKYQNMLGPTQRIKQEDRSRKREQEYFNNLPMGFENSKFDNI